MSLRVVLCVLAFSTACAGGGIDHASPAAFGEGSTGEAADPPATTDNVPPPAEDGSESGAADGCNLGERGCACAPHDACKLGLECIDGTCETCDGCGWCGDGTCDAPETCSDCPADCQACESCGDGTCDETETCASCPADCDPCESCGNDICDVAEDCYACEADCGACMAPDPCAEADAGAGAYCGSSIGGDANVLYSCSASGTTLSTQDCTNGCASCPQGTADVCQAAGETVDEACGVAECDYNDDPDGCGATSQWCFQGECRSCTTGFNNCDETLGCECNGYCSTTVSGLCCTQENGCTAGCPFC